MTEYYKCNMTPLHHILAYIVASAIAFAVVYIFYHLVGVSLVLGLALGIYLERMYADSLTRKRQRNLRLQFRTFLESMTVSTRAGNSPTNALKSALEDLRVSYRDDADIVIEIQNIIEKYEGGGISLTVLFNDLADRSRLEDIRSFASIYEVMEGKNNRIGDILAETSQIIGDKIEIEQEIETTITSAKSETYMMLVMPIVIVLAMTFMGGGLMSALFTTVKGHLAATVALITFALSYIISVKISDIDV